MPETIRRAREVDDAALAQIDRDAWSGSVTPAPRWPADGGFFQGGSDPRDVLVASVDGTAVGYVKLGSPTRLPSNGHVLEIQGLAVSPAYQGHGLGRRLLVAAIEEARSRGVRRLTLRVLATNRPARELYLSAGFEIEGVLREEFLVDGAYVDDVLMAIRVK
jgi:ribosomal protein S18 acetylase RimI-like enzyme